MEADKRKISLPLAAIIMTSQAILADLKQRKFAPVYLLQGEEPYFIDVISDYIEQHALSDAEKGFNQTIVYGKETDVLSVVNWAKRYPMMSEYQVVLVKEAQAMDWSRNEEMMAAYLENPLTSTILVFCYKYKKFDKRKKLYKAFKSKGLIFESNKIYDSQVAGWIGDHCREHGYKIQPEASALIGEYLGNDLSKIANELEKLMLNVPKDRNISTLDVQDNIGISKDFNVFELNKALAFRDVYKANQILNYFSANPKLNPMPLVIGAMGGYFIKVLKCHYTADKSRAALAKAAGVPEFFVGEYQQAIRNFNKEKTFTIISLLREYDMKSKGVNAVRTDSGPLLKELIYKILH